MWSSHHQVNSSVQRNDYRRSDSVHERLLADSLASSRNATPKSMSGSRAALMSLMDEIREALAGLKVVEQELSKVKADAVNLQSFNKKIESNFVRIEKTFFSKVVIK